MVEVVAGEVAHVELKPGEPEADRWAARRQTLLSIGGITVKPGEPEVAPLTVFLPDGTTPAFAAQAFLYEPGHEQPEVHGISDGSGRLTWRGIWSSGNVDDHPKTGFVEKPTLVVSLPGRHGATLVTVGEERPGEWSSHPQSRPRVRSRSVASPRTATVRSSASWPPTRGEGSSTPLGLATTAGPDGRFRLAEAHHRPLPDPGRPRRNLISKAVELQVEPDKVPPPLILEIPAPGESVTLEFVDHAGRPLADESFTLACPPGPFASLWPATPPGRRLGRLTLQGLEEGLHSVSISGTTETATFRVGEAPGQPAQVAVKQVILQRRVP